MKAIENNPVTVTKYDGSPEMIKQFRLSEGVAEVIQTPDGPEEVSGMFLASDEDESGYVRVKVGDWIKTSPNSNPELIDSEDFAKNYKLLPVIPENISEYIKYCKQQGYDVICSVQRMNGLDEMYPDVFNWIKDNGDKFAEAWLLGYQVEENIIINKWNVVIGQSLSTRYNTWLVAYRKDDNGNFFVDNSVSFADLSQERYKFTDSDFNKLLYKLYSMPYGDSLVRIAKLGKELVLPES